MIWTINLFLLRSAKQFLRIPLLYDWTYSSYEGEILLLQPVFRLRRPRNKGPILQPLYFKGNNFLSEKGYVYMIRLESIRGELQGTAFWPSFRPTSLVTQLHRCTSVSSPLMIGILTSYTLNMASGLKSTDKYEKAYLSACNTLVRRICINITKSFWPLI